MGNWWLAASSQHIHSCITSGAEFLAKHQITQMTQLHYSPDLVPCKFWFFLKLKSPLKGKKFQIINQIQKNRMGQLMVIPTKDFAECFEQWKRCWENSVRSQGAYFERDRSIIVLCTLFLVSCVFFNNCVYFSRYVAGYFLDRSPKLNRYFGNIKVNWRTMIIILERGWCLEQVGLNRPLRYG